VAAQVRDGLRPGHHHDPRPNRAHTCVPTLQAALNPQGDASTDDHAAGTSMDWSYPLYFAKLSDPVDDQDAFDQRAAPERVYASQRALD